MKDAMVLMLFLGVHDFIEKVSFVNIDRVYSSIKQPCDELWKLT
jgi:hypothetical protein